MKKWFIVSPYNGENNVIIHGNPDDYKLLSNGGEITSKSRIFNTKEELYEECKILPFNCRKCGSIIKSNYIEEEAKKLREKHLCFTCNHWDEIYKDMSNKRQIIIKGESYYIENDNPNAAFQGYGGRLIKIKRFDSDKIIYTKNLWNQGKISKHWKQDFPDNAEFIK